MKAVLCLSATLIASALLAKQPYPSPTPLSLTPSQAARLSAYTPQPDYPIAARRRHVTGSGIFRIQIQRQSGLATSVQIERSTGHAVFDAAATATLRRWRLKPEVLRSYTDPREHSPTVTVRVPIIFTM